MLMFARQQMRNEPISPSIPTVTYQNLPIIVVSTQLLLRLLHIDLLAMDLHFSIISLFFSWSYLRFYYKFHEGEEWGDRSEDFSFVAMFPEVSHCFLLFLTSQLHNYYKKEPKLSS